MWSVATAMGARLSQERVRTSGTVKSRRRMRGKKNTKTACSKGLSGQTRHYRASVYVERHANILHAMVKSDPRGSLTSELYSWRRT